MTKSEFLEELRCTLAPKLPAEELSDVLAYYEEYFADAGEDRETQVLEELGSPAAAAAKVLEDRGEDAPERAPARKPLSKKSKVLLLCGGLLLVFGILTCVLMSLTPSGQGKPEELNYPLHGVVAGSEDHADELSDLDAFYRLELDLPAASVTLAPDTEGTGLHVEHWGTPNPVLYYNVQNGTLHLWTEPHEETEAAGGEIVLYLPQNLYRAEVKLGSGSVTAHGIAIEELKVCVDTGNVFLDGLTVELLDTEVGTGTVCLNRVEGQELRAVVDQVGEDRTLEQYAPETIAEKHNLALTAADCRAEELVEFSCRTGDMTVTGDFPCPVTLRAPGSHLYFSTKQSGTDYTLNNINGSGVYFFGYKPNIASNTDVIISAAKEGTWRLQTESGGTSYLYFRQ